MRKDSDGLSYSAATEDIYNYSLSWGPTSQLKISD